MYKKYGIKICNNDSGKTYVDTLYFEDFDVLSEVLDFLKKHNDKNKWIFYIQIPRF